MEIIFLNKIKINRKLNASSLINALFVCIIVSVFCGCLVLFAHYQNLLNDRLTIQEELININDSSFNYLISNAEVFPPGQMQQLDIFEEGIPTYMKKMKWGFYDVLICKTVFKNDTISKIALVGQKNKYDNPLALYVTNYDKPLKLSGKTTIKGQIKIPTGLTEQAYINGKMGNTITLTGEKLKSERKFPKIVNGIDLSTYENTSGNTIGTDTLIVNGFDQETKIIDISSTTTVTNVSIKGNIILVSKNELEISETAHLEDVLVVAPIIHLKSGFKGNIQMVSSRKIILEDWVLLKYPSSIYMKNDIDSLSVSIGQNSTFVGGIVLDGDTSEGTIYRTLTIKDKAKVIGDVYCYGRTQLNGEVIGSLYTDKFFLKTESSTYENVILNGTINRDSLPQNFVGLQLFSNVLDKKEYAIIKEL